MENIEITALSFAIGLIVVSALTLYKIRIKQESPLEDKLKVLLAVIAMMTSIEYLACAFGLMEGNDIMVDPFSCAGAIAIMTISWNCVRDAFAKKPNSS